MFRLRIKNFQIIRKADITFKPGLNVIIGPTNNGKSAIFRAIEAAIYNKSTDSVITAGERKAAVGIDYNGHSVIWQRDSGRKDFKVVYTIDGEGLTKVGRGLLEEVEGALGITEIELLKSKEKINFIKQMSYPFLLDKTPSQLFEFLSLSAEEENLNKILSTMKQDYRSMTDSLQSLNGAMDVLKENKFKERHRYEKGSGFLSNKEYEWIMSEVERFEKLENIEKKAEDIKSKTEAIEETEKKLMADERVCEEISPLTERIGEIFRKTELIEAGINNLRRAIGQEVLIKNDLEKTEVWVKEFNKDNLENVMDILKARKEEIAKREAMLKEFRRSETSVRDIEKKINTSSRELESALDELKEFKVCPVCGSDLSNKEGCVDYGVI